MKNTMYEIDLVEDRALISILGEVCWGFHVDNFENQIVASILVVESILNRLVNEEKAGIVETYISFFEVEIIQRAFREVLKEIEEWEFSTRIGISIDEVKEIMDKIT